MASTKTNTAVFAAQSVAAGGSETSSTVDLSTSYGIAALNIKITNGGTGPTIPLTVTVQLSNDNSVFYDYLTVVGSTVNSAVVQAGGIEIPEGIQRLKLVATGNTAQAVTVNADISRITAL